jgi:hypothetical protein
MRGECVRCGHRTNKQAALCKGCNPRRRDHEWRKRERDCLTCGSPFRTVHGRYCSLACRPLEAEAPARRAERERVRQVRRRERESVEEAQKIARAETLRAAEELKEQARNRVCLSCGVRFRARDATGLRRFCSVPCWPSVTPSHGALALTCVRCGDAFASRQPNARYCSIACRRALARKAPSEYARRRAADKIKRLRPVILEKFGRMCYLCLRPIDRDFHDMHPLGMTLDHVVPINAGGRDDETNLRPAHRACNEDKGERLPTWWERRQAGMAA